MKGKALAYPSGKMVDHERAGGCWREFDGLLDFRTQRAEVIERTPNMLLPFCYPTRWQRLTQADP
jgi:hypothetical protein